MRANISAELGTAQYECEGRYLGANEQCNAEIRETAQRWCRDKRVLYGSRCDCDKMEKCDESVQW